MRNQPFTLLIPLAIIGLLAAGCDLLGDTSRDATLEYRTEILLEHSGALSPIAISPDETQILLSVRSQTALFDLATGALRQITSGDTIHTPIAFSPDGSRILYESGSNIGIMNSDGSSRNLLVTGDHFNFRHTPVAFSSDGNKILVNTFLADDETREWRVGVYSLSDGSLERLTDRYSYAADYSPDGERILYWVNIEGNYDMWIMNSDGSGKVNLTNDQSDSMPVAVAENGWSILYYRDEIGPNQVMITDIEGAQREEVIEHTRSVPTAISPTGRYVAYYEASGRGICPLCSVSKIYIVASNGTGKTQVKTGDFHPGRIVAFFSDGNSFLHSSRKDGTTRLLRTTIAE